MLLWLCLCRSAEGSHLVSIKVLETGAEWVHFKICSCGKIKRTPHWFCGCSQIYIIRLQWAPPVGAVRGRLYAGEVHLQAAAGMLGCWKSKTSRSGKHDVYWERAGDGLLKWYSSGKRYECNWCFFALNLNISVFSVEWFTHNLVLVGRFVVFLDFCV